MTGIIRPRGGRPNKVTKTGATPRRPGRQPAAAAIKMAEADDLQDSLVAAEGDHHHHQHQHHHQHHQHGMPAHLGAGGGDDMGDMDAEAEAELDEASAATAHAPAAAATAHHSLALSATGILSNGGGGVGGGGTLIAPAITDDPPSSVYPAPATSPPPPPPPPPPQDYGAPPPLPSQPAGGGGDHTGKTTQDMARESGYDGVVGESALAKRLAREPALRPARQRRPEQHLNLGRRSNVEALFAHIAGHEVVPSCKNCHKGHGPWTACVVVEGQMCGSCANCWFNASGARCSFHEARTGHQMPVGHNQHHMAPQPPPPPPPPPPHATASSSVVADANAFTLASEMSLAGSAGPSALGAVNFGSALALQDPMVAYTIERAFAEVRGADKKTRQLMMIELQAKQLALSIMAHEEDRVHDEPPLTQPDLGGDED